MRPKGASREHPAPRQVRAGQNHGLIPSSGCVIAHQDRLLRRPASGHQAGHGLIQLAAIGVRGERDRRQGFHAVRCRTQIEFHHPGPGRRLLAQDGISCEARIESGRIAVGRAEAREELPPVRRQVVRFGRGQQAALGVRRAREVVLGKAQAQRVVLDRQRVRQRPAVSGLGKLLALAEEGVRVLVKLMELALADPAVPIAIKLNDGLPVQVRGPLRAGHEPIAVGVHNLEARIAGLSLADPAVAVPVQLLEELFRQWLTAGLLVQGG